MHITLEPNEIQFLTALLRQISVNAAQADAGQVIASVQALLAKLNTPAEAA